MLRLILLFQDIKKRDAEVAEKQYAAVELKTEENHRDDGKKKKIILKREMEKQNSSGEKETNRESMHESTQDEEIENSEEMMDEELKELKEEQEKFRKTFQSDRHLKVLEKCKEKSQELKKLSNNESVPERPEDVKTFFVQVALFYKGACFGFGEFS